MWGVRRCRGDYQGCLEMVSVGCQEGVKGCQRVSRVTRNSRRLHGRKRGAGGCQGVSGEVSGCQLVFWRFQGVNQGLSGECPLGVRECVRGHLVSVACQEMSGM